MALRSHGRWPASAYHLQAVLEARQRLEGADHFATHACRLELGITRLYQKKFADAEPLLLEAYTGLKKNTVDAKGQLAQTALQRLVELYERSEQADKTAEWRKKLDEYKKR